MEAERAHIYYQQLKHYYLKADSDWTDKARSFRTIIHEFYNELTMSDGTFAEALHQFFKSGKQKTVADFAFKVKDTLNEIVHHNDRITKERLVVLYDSCVRLIYLATEVVPDEHTMELLGMKKIDHLDGLNHQQRDAVECDDKVVYVNAGPGTGKTRLLANKIIQYICKSEHTEKIIALSYTNTAANELGDRFRRQAFDIKVDKPYNFYNGTLHSFCFKILRSFYATKGMEFNCIIIDDYDINELAEEIRIQLGDRFTTAEIANCLKSKPDIEDRELKDLVDEIKRKYNIMSIDDILARFIRVFQEEEAFRTWIKDQITIIIVDEAQDLSIQNFKIFKLLMELIPDLKMYLVGDPRQNIYGFNGGSYEHLNKFLKDCGSYTEKTLSITYRCPVAVCNYVNTFEFTDCSNVALQSESEIDGELNVHGFIEYDKEISFLLNKLASSEDNSNTAVLCQNLRYLVPLMEGLCKRKIPYKIYGGKKTVKPHIKVLNHLLRIISTENDYSVRLISREFKVDLNKLASQYGCNHKEAFYFSAPGKAIKVIKQEIERFNLAFPSILSMLMEEVFIPIPEGQDQSDFEKIVAASRAFKTIEEYLLAFATNKETFGCFYEKDYIEYPERIEGRCLMISTIHSAKGLEWETVYLAGVNEGNLPNSFFVRDKSEEKQRAYFNECKKAMYVAATRTSKDLVITFSMENQNGYPAGPSRFLSGLVNTTR